MELDQFICHGESNMLINLYLQWLKVTQGLQCILIY